MDRSGSCLSASLAALAPLVQRFLASPKKLRPVFAPLYFWFSNPNARTGGVARRYSYLSAAIGSTFAALLAGM